ncbi:hypothetical protein B0O99DRAFT_693819 [Bisporella sp. PMI_857]|nr:hypothetical protein B0O99DRAFT_693819 [Bisporella sp. PMI_857]
MVVVISEGRPQSEIFVPQQVPEKFDPNVALLWLEFCKHHKNLCNPKSPKVNRMKVINCDSEDWIIRDHHPVDKYVALSYVWGSPVLSKTPTLALTGTETPQREVCINTKAKGLQPIAHTSQHMPNSQPNLISNKPDSNQASAIVVKTAHYATAMQENKSVSRLPDGIPLTIRDAIQVAKAFGYRFL